MHTLLYYYNAVHLDNNYISYYRSCYEIHADSLFFFIYANIARCSAVNCIRTYGIYVS